MPPRQAQPLVSVVLATHNRAGWVAGAIDSVLAQEFPALELVIVDDGSTDGTSDVLERYRPEGRIRILANAENRGLPFSLNRGIEAARGEYLARIDDDDRWIETRKLALQVQYLEAHPDCGLLGTAYVDEWGAVAYNPLEDAQIRRQMLFRCPFCHSSVVLRARALAEAGGYDVRLEFAEDWDLWMRLGQHWHLANLATVTVRRAQGEDALTGRFFSRQAATAVMLLDRHGREYPARRRARLYHCIVGVFFRLAPPGGRFHRWLQPVFAAVFSLRSTPASAESRGESSP